MKYFTEPTGRFVIKIPTEWQYKNIELGYKEQSPFSFQLYENPIGAFQISCYSDEENPVNPNMPKQKANTRNLDFIEGRLDGEGFNVHLWYAVVENYSFIAKYIYGTKKEKNPLIKIELEKVKKALSTLELISHDERSLAIEFDKYEKFMASLAASFDIKSNAIKNESLIELLIIIANQIDAYLRLAIVMKKQLRDKTNRIDIPLLFQGENDSPIMERKIYKQALNFDVIDSTTFDRLEELYKERNKVVHRYIITEFKTRDLYKIVYEYEVICETVRLSLKDVENLQFKEKIGIHGNQRNPMEEPSELDKQMLFSQINDKHLLKEFYRKINT